MRIYINNKQITKKATLGRRLSFAGLLILLLGMAASFSPGMIANWAAQGNSLAKTPLATWLWQGGWLIASMVSLLIGFLLGQIGNHLIRRYQRVPRPDQSVAKALKGFDDRNHLFVWSSPVDLVFAGPAGVYAIVTRDLDGPITVNNDRIKRPFSLRRVLFAFGQEAPGLPVQEANDAAQKLEAWLNEGLNDSEPVTVHPLVVFTHEKAKLDVQSASAAVLHAKGLKQFLRNQLRNSKSLPKATMAAVLDKLKAEAERQGADLLA